jgi:hypothetical protein
LAQRLLPRHALLLKRGPGLDECGPGLLKLAFRLLRAARSCRSCSSAR